MAMGEKRVAAQFERASLIFPLVCLVSSCRLQLLSLGDEYLDAPLHGGVGEGITELVGESACGKTQMAMQLLFQVRDDTSTNTTGAKRPVRNHAASRALNSHRRACPFACPAPSQCQLPKSEGGLNGGALFIAMEGQLS